MSLQELKEYFDSKFAEISAKSSLSKQEKPLALKKKGNQNQVEHAQEVLLSVKLARSALSEKNPEVADKHLEAAEKALLLRIKHIRLADKFPHGWDTADVLASDDEDD